MGDVTLQEIAELTKDYPRFTDGRIDYTNQYICPVMNCTVLWKDAVLLAFRSAAVIAYLRRGTAYQGLLTGCNHLSSL